MGKIACPSCKKDVDEDMLFCPYCFEEFKPREAAPPPKKQAEEEEKEDQPVKKPVKKEKIKDDLFGPDEDRGMLIDDRYSIVEPLHFSCSRAIYKVEDVSEPDTFFSLREFLIQGEDLAQKDEIAFKFEEAAERFVNVSHKGLSRVIDYFCEDNYLYLVFEFKQGMNVVQFLQDFIRKTNQGLPEGLIVHWALSLCETLEYLHNLESGPLFCIDFKPSFLIMSPDYDRLIFVNIGLPYILDAIGILRDDGTVNLKEMKAEYKSPSRDIWCLGALLYYFLTGNNIQKENALPAKPLAEVRPDLTPQFQEIVKKMLGSEGLSHYRDVRDVKKELQETCRPRPVSAYDFYYDYCGIDYMAHDWKAFSGNNQRTGSLGAGPRIPMKIQWQAASRTGTLAYLMTYENYIISSFNDGEFFMFNASTGSVDWRLPLRETINPPVMYDNMIFLSTSSSQELIAIKVGKGSPHWAVNLDGMAMSSPCVKEEMVYQVTFDGTIIAVEMDEGEIFWREPLDARVLSAPLLDRDNLYINALNGTVYSVNLEDRDFNWQFDTEGSLSSAPALWKKSLYVGNNEGYIISIDTASGDVRWEFDLKGSITQPVRVINDMIFCVTQKGVLNCLEPVKGDTRWKVTVGAPGEYPFAITNNKIYMVMPDNRIYCIDAFSGKLVDKVKFDEKIISAPLIYRGTLVLITQSGTVFCYK